MSSLVSFLYKAARTANDLQTFTSGNPKRIARRLKNKLIGRTVVSRMYRFPF
jgi:hypothetical protein